MKQARIVVASERLPVAALSHSHGPARALRQLHAQLDAPWVGRSEGVESSGPGLRPVTLRGSGHEQYSLTVLWPLFHYLLDRVRLDANESWRAYVEANEYFARALAAEVQPLDMVWIHDYQLALVPALLRQLVPSARIGFFSHVPWPSADVLRILPACKQLLTGVLGADLIGFQTETDRQNFVHAAADVAGAAARTEVLRWKERDVHTGVYPIGVDVDAFGRSSVELDAAVDLLHAQTRGKSIVLSVDRLDHTQGVPQRLHAIERLLEREPALRDRLHFLQLAFPSREDHSELRSDVNELVARINSVYGSVTGSPVQLLHRSIPVDQLISLYRAASVMLVTPLRAGVNLAAKEYAAARTDNLGCLVLSEFAGAVSELTSALRINPYDTPALATTIQHALSMPEAEQRLRMRELRRVVADQSVGRWAAAFLSDLSRATGMTRSKSNCGQKLTAASPRDVASDLVP